jgi:DNA sulfur modification protein DndD
MVINRVVISNFFCYVEDNVFDFEEGLNIVSAKNSGGKSHLFNAFHWTFFNVLYVDKEKDTTKKEWKSADKVVTLPDYIIANSEVGDTLKTTIDILLTAKYHEGKENTNELVEYRFVKEMQFRKGERDDDVYPIDKPQLQISFVKDGETKFLVPGEHRWFLDTIFPVSIRKFMWFQGETVDELYDFNNPSTLNYAIKEISYFPIYENMVNITKESVRSIGTKINAELRKIKKLTSEQNILISEIEFKTNSLSTIGDKLIEAEMHSKNCKDAIVKEQEKLKGVSKYSQLQTKVTALEYEIKTINDKIDALSANGKVKFISKWMLNKCDRLIEDATPNLELLSTEIKSYQKSSENPVPMTLPGPEYVQQMLDKHICYICERPVEEDTPAWVALNSRMEDFKNNQVQKILANNYTDLKKFKRHVLAELPLIAEEVSKNEGEISLLLNERKKMLGKKENLYSESGIEKWSEITIGATNAEQVINKINSLNSSKSGYDGKIILYKSQREDLEKKLQALNSNKITTISSEDSEKIKEISAQKYIDLIDKALKVLKDDALEKLMKEINTESNVLYSKYLGGNTQGEIEIDEGVKIIDKLTRKPLSNLNTAELTAQKLAVANAFLSLSEKKMNRSFPLLADAPTSQFDDDNTLFLTENLNDSFKQIIIMSKDYKLSGDDRLQFIHKAKINKFYELVNDIIDRSGPESRINRKTYVEVIK